MTVAVTTNVTSFTVTGLGNGTTYSFTVSAVNGVGMGSASSPSAAVTPLGVASAPTAFAETHSSAGATVTWNAPATNGGQAVLGYRLELRIADEDWVVLSTSATSPFDIDGLSPGTSYEARVLAVNAVGNSEWQTVAFSIAAPPTSGISAPIHIDENGTITDVPVFVTATPELQITASTPSGLGSWTLTPDGGVFTAGDAGFFGSLGGSKLNAPAVGIAPIASGDGYYVVGSDGGVFAFGEAEFRGSMGGTPLNAPVTGIAPGCEGVGYYLVANDGGVFAFGDVGFHGSMAGKPLNAGMLAIVDACGKAGY